MKKEMSETPYYNCSFVGLGGWVIGCSVAVRVAPLGIFSHNTSLFKVLPTRNGTPDSGSTKAAQPGPTPEVWTVLSVTQESQLSTLLFLCVLSYMSSGNPPGAH
jgi:hypothetical protein